MNILSNCSFRFKTARIPYSSSSNTALMKCCCYCLLSMSELQYKCSSSSNNRRKSSFQNSVLPNLDFFLSFSGFFVSIPISTSGTCSRMADVKLVALHDGAFYFRLAPKRWKLASKMLNFSYLA